MCPLELCESRVVGLTRFFFVSGCFFASLMGSVNHHDLSTMPFFKAGYFLAGVHTLRFP